MPRGTITERLKITLQNILFHRSWPVEWSSHPHPKWRIPVNLQATTENSSLSTLLDLSSYNKKIEIKNCSLYLFNSLASLHLLNNAWDLVLRALPLSVCLFKINRFMYSPIVSRMDKSIFKINKCKCKCKLLNVYYIYGGPNYLKLKN